MITLNTTTAIVSHHPTGDVSDPARWSVNVPHGSPGIMAGHAEVEAMCAGVRLIGKWQRDERRPELWHMSELKIGPTCRTEPGE